LAKTHKIDFVWIELTQQCNHQCIFCYEKSSPHNTKKMSFKDFCTAIDNLKDFEIKKIQLIGGEPLLLGSQLKKMIQYCGNDFDYLEIFTNATLINEDWCKFFQKNNIRIALSLHSYNPTQHDKVTQKKGSGKATQKAIELLTKHYIKFRIATVKTKYNQLGKKPNKSPYQLKIDNARLTEREDFKLYNFAMFKSKAITKERLKSQLQEKRIIERISGHPCFSQKLYISHNLDVYPCVMERRFLHGNIKKQKLIKIIKPAIQSLSKDKIETCKICEFRYACHDCRPDSMGADKLQKPWYCSYDPVTGTWEDLKKMFKRLK